MEWNWESLATKDLTPQAVLYQGLILPLPQVQTLRPAVGTGPEDMGAGGPSSRTERWHSAFTSQQAKSPARYSVLQSLGFHCGSFFSEAHGAKFNCKLSCKNTPPASYHSVLEYFGLEISALARVEAEPSIPMFALCDAARGLLLALRQVQAGHNPRIWKPPSVLREGPWQSQS